MKHIFLSSVLLCLICGTAISQTFSTLNDAKINYSAIESAVNASGITIKSQKYLSTVDFIIFKLSINKDPQTVKFLFKQTLDLYSDLQKDIDDKWSTLSVEKQILLNSIDKKFVVVSNEVIDKKDNNLTIELMPTLLMLITKIMYIML